MSKGKIAVLLLAILFLNLSTGACGGLSSQGPQEQNRPSESQETPAEEETTEETARNPAKTMEETAKEEATESR